ncbi:hypothetical protein PRIPAC_86251 [Pristionchus pacificus]|uniref:Helicase n=1 Tax=Pristionchus pacificus TaxID=54126 RepID=A0A2A6BKY4_PRIPA|nr:hypothetical protein PRIPAC_86251 [Pristionchus pacificus]|eukprot:PDM66575.1 helicase [Pristionchus pacificus]
MLCWNDMEEVAKKCPHVVVGTPARTRALIENGALKTDTIKHFVLDDCDEMFRKNDLRISIEAIMKHMIVTAATSLKQLHKFCKKWMSKDVSISDLAVMIKFAKSRSRPMNKSIIFQPIGAENFPTPTFHKKILSNACFIACSFFIYFETMKLFTLLLSSLLLLEAKHKLIKIQSVPIEFFDGFKHIPAHEFAMKFLLIDSEISSYIYSCRFSYCHNEDKNDCKNTCLQMAMKMSKESIANVTVDLTKPSPDVEDCNQKCPLVCGKNDCSKECSILCSVHFSYENSVEYMTEYEEIVTRFNKLFNLRCKALYCHFRNVEGLHCNEACDENVRLYKKVTQSTGQPDPDIGTSKLGCKADCVRAGACDKSCEILCDTHWMYAHRDLYEAEYLQWAKTTGRM